MAKVPDLATRFSTMEKRRRVRRVLFWFVLLALIAGGLGWGTNTIVRWERFEVREVAVEGVRRVSREDVLAMITQKEIQGSALRAWLGEKNFLAWPTNISGDSLRSLPLLRAVTIHADYDAHRIVVRVEERNPFGIFCGYTHGVTENSNTPQCLWFDEEGVLLGDAFQAEGSLIPVLIQNVPVLPRVGTQVAIPEFMKNILAIFQVVRDGGVDVKVVELRDPALQEVSVATYEGPALYFSIRTYPEGAASLLRSLKANGAFRRLEYVDFRVVNRAYYK